MPVRLDRVPAPAQRSQPPRLWLWLGLLVLCLLLGVGVTLWLGDEALGQQPGRFWLQALGIPLVVWCGVVLLRVFAFLLDEGAAEGWDEARYEDLSRRIARGRRSQQVLAVSLYSAFRESPTADGQARQLEALLGGDSAMQPQKPWQGEAEVRHSRLPVGNAQKPQELLGLTLKPVLADLAEVLDALPPEQPLALLLEADGALPVAELVSAWQWAWGESGIRQPITSLDGSGLTVVDQWLDQRIRDKALLLVVAFQMAPADVEDSAEAVVGLLFGNRLTQHSLPPLAFLHRPEEEHGLSTADLDYATRQSLTWAQLEASAIERVWLAGVDSERHADLSRVLKGLSIPVKPKQGLYDLDSALGRTGKAASWCAIAAAAQAIQRDARPQLIFSGAGQADKALWCLALKPVSANE